MFKAKAIYKANIEGDYTIEQQVEKCDYLARSAGGYKSKEFQLALRYEVTRTVINILSNATIKYAGQSNTMTNSLQSNLVKIFFKLHDKGQCYLFVNRDNVIENISETSGNVKIVDPAYDITGITQRIAVQKHLDMYGVITDVKFSVIDERGVMGIFSPKKDVTVLETKKKALYESFRNLFGAKKGQRKFAILETGMDYQGVTLPIAELNLIENEKQALGNVARTMMIQEDMLLRGGTYDNKANAIVQTYTDYKGWVYDLINQIEKNLISFRSIEAYEVTFGGVPQLDKTDSYEQK